VRKGRFRTACAVPASLHRLNGHLPIGQLCHGTHANNHTPPGPPSKPIIPGHAFPMNAAPSVRPLYGGTLAPIPAALLAHHILRVCCRRATELVDSFMQKSSPSPPCSL